VATRIDPPNPSGNPQTGLATCHSPRRTLRKAGATWTASRRTWAFRQRPAAARGVDHFTPSRRCERLHGRCRLTRRVCSSRPDVSNRSIKSTLCAPRQLQLWPQRPLALWALGGTCGAVADRSGRPESFERLGQSCRGELLGGIVAAKYCVSPAALATTGRKAETRQQAPGAPHWCAPPVGGEPRRGRRPARVVLFSGVAANVPIVLPLRRRDGPSVAATGFVFAWSVLARGCGPDVAQIDGQNCGISIPKDASHQQNRGFPAQMRPFRLPGVDSRTRTLAHRRGVAVAKMTHDHCRLGACVVSERPIKTIFRAYSPCWLDAGRRRWMHWN
jgi:hypothetical protein